MQGGCRRSRAATGKVRVCFCSDPATGHHATGLHAVPPCYWPPFPSDEMAVRPCQRPPCQSDSITFGGNLPQRLFENFHGLSALNQIFVIDDDRGHSVDTLLAIELFARADLIGIET